VSEEEQQTPQNPAEQLEALTPMEAQAQDAPVLEDGAPEDAAPKQPEQGPRSVFSGSKPLVFGRWDPTEVIVNDPSVRQYLNLKPIVVPHTGARHGHKRFGKKDVSMVERLINDVMRNEKNTGAKQRAYRVVQHAFEIIEERTHKNPLQVLADAVVQAGPREETVRLRYGGINVPKAVDTAPQRRVDKGLMFIAKGAEQASFKARKPIYQCLADEIMAAAVRDAKSFSVSRRDEKERVAKAAR